MITITDYWMGRDAEYPLAMSPDIERNAHRTCELVSKLIAIARTAGVPFLLNPRTGSNVSSGWRPPALNAITPNAAKRSLHMTGQAVDVYDPHGTIDRWLMTDDGQRTIKDLGLWMEHPSATPGWAHVQTMPPRSGNRVFKP
jgi:hypothetical protein